MQDHSWNTVRNSPHRRCFILILGFPFENTSFTSVVDYHKYPRPASEVKIEEQAERAKYTEELNQIPSTSEPLNIPSTVETEKGDMAATE